jgi:hypothetical protein
MSFDRRFVGEHRALVLFGGSAFVVLDEVWKEEPEQTGTA